MLLLEIIPSEIAIVRAYQVTILKAYFDQIGPQSNQSNQSHEKYSWNFYSRLDLSLWIIFFCSCILGEGLDEGMDILHEMILSNRRRRRQNASNHIGPPKPQRRKVRRSQSTYHWRSTVGSKCFWNCILILSVVRQSSDVVKMHQIT